MVSRREFLLAGGAAVCFRNETLNLVEKLAGRFASAPERVAQDEMLWVQIQQSFTLDRTMINLNNGGVCPSPRVVQDALRRYLEYSNQAPSYFMWRHLEPEVESVRKRLAAAFGCSADELAITRNASEALEICLLGINLQPGDEVLTTTLDYPRMITTIRQRERRDGVKLVQAKVPSVPSSRQELVDALRQGVTPKTKLILICHVIFLNGHIFPVADVCKLGTELGIPVIVDGAHAFAHLPFRRDELGCEYYGTSLHKWLMAPIGTGFLYVKRNRIAGLWPLMAAPLELVDDIRKFEEIGTHPAANHNAVAEALTFHEMIGVERKAARLRHLHGIWTSRIRGEKGVRFHTSLKPSDSCGLVTFEIRGIAAAELADWLWAKHGILVSPISHPQFTGIRVTPNVYTTASEMGRFADAMLQAARQGI